MVIDFEMGDKPREFLLTLHEIFPLLEHFLEEEDWAAILVILTEKKATLAELKKMRRAFKIADSKLREYYPTMVPPKPKVVGRYPFEGVLAVVVNNLSQMLVYMHSRLDYFIYALGG